METIYDEDETDDSSDNSEDMVLLKLDRDFTLTHDRHVFFTDLLFSGSFCISDDISFVTDTESSLPFYEKEAKIGNYSEDIWFGVIPDSAKGDISLLKFCFFCLFVVLLSQCWRYGVDYAAKLIIKTQYLLCI